MNKTMVKLEGVSLIYHEKSGETPAIDKLCMEVAEGEFVAIVGPSGCGKTSVLSLMAGLMEPSCGTVFVRDASPGYMLQHDHLLDWRSIAGNITLGLEVKRCLDEASRAYAAELLRTYGLADFASYYPRQLSGGMRQKVALIRTLATRPDLLLLDEPFSALDYQTRLTVADEIHGIIKCEKKTAILVTHDISEAISMSDRVLVFTARPATLKAEHKIALTSADNPIARRNAPEFKDYFDAIWKELENERKQ